ncbi:putative dynamin central domain, Dynamin superfamily [Helianthus annuus]|uniref:Dynamin central domain-containing protein n=1 Tax=Helianthus annuus TaxID=4232 RepID=A0A9K3NXE8_HELAN|nr:putative dynamin central domain-containing protein [Helianthus annuus]KAJ0601433.1 putative dynamin central domain, Dynamin superfamily [Helianthus annuus]KAJ0801813.1 putative dynamin stalk domain, Dynamin superfamily [Helianthus annuus]KAJ0936295.1 putative dynamin central domain, Dynamin superfamily [Helianthus annuus]KAJ0944218.1 putative dynamin central domain-containing protein [Helianthus annuus]
MVGIPVLAHRLVQIQSVIISKCLPEIVKKIDERLKVSVLDLNKLPRILKSETDAMATFIKIVGL